MNTKPTVDEVLDSLDDTLRAKVGQSWDMVNVEVEDGGCRMTLVFWDCKEGFDEEEDKLDK